MKAVVQRVRYAEVRTSGEVVGRCERGFLVLVAAERSDDEQNADKTADRIAGLRVMDDGQGKMNLSLSQAELPGPQVLVVPNFTLCGDVTQRRPNFTAAAPFDRGRELFEVCVAGLRRRGLTVATGRYGAHMEIEMLADGPVTLVLEG